MKSHTPHIAVVGAGPGGLAVSALLARRGFRVTLFEKRAEVGGRNGRLREAGYTFDIGPTFVMMPFILEEIFRECGRALSDEVDLRPLEPFYRLTFHDGAVFQPGSDPERVIEQLSRLAPGDAPEFRRYLSFHAKKMDAILPCLNKPYAHLGHLLRPSLMKALPYLGISRTVWDELGRFFKDDRVKTAFTFQSKYLGMSPFNCPSLFSILSYTEYRWGVFHPLGGVHQLSLALERLARGLGVDIRLQTPVARVDIVRGEAQGVVLEDGAQARFDEVVLNADFAWAMRHLIPNDQRRRYRDEQLDKKKYSCSTFMMYLGLDRPVPELDHHNVFIAQDYRANLQAIENGDPLPEDFSFYVQNACVTDPSLAPKGHAALYVLVPTSNLMKGPDWDKEAARFRARVLKSIEERAGVKNLSAHITYEKILTPLDWERRMNVGYGATFNLAHNLGQMLLWRPHNKFEEFERVWLVGGGTHPGSGLPTIYESARITANLLTDKYHPPRLTIPLPSLAPNPNLYAPHAIPKTSPV